MKKSKLINILVGIICLAAFIWLCKVFLLGNYPDFNTQYYVPKMMLQRINPYSGGSQLFTPQVYPPTVFFVFFPLTFLSVIQASYVYTTLSIFSLVFSLYLLSKIFNVNFLGTQNLIFMTFAVISFPVKFTLGMGQINMFILLLMTLTLLFIKNRKNLIAGIFLGLAIVIKLFPLFLPLYLLIKFKKGNRGMAIPWTRVKVWIQKKQLANDLEVLDGMLLVIVISMFLIALFIPKDYILHFFFVTIPSLSSSWKLDYYNQALSGFIGRGLGVGELANIIKIVLGLIITFITLYLIGKNEKEGIFPDSLKFGILITLSLIVNNFSWQHHFVWLIIPFYITFIYLKNINAKLFPYFILGISYILVSINFKDPQILPIFLQSHVLFGALILLMLNLFLLSKSKNTEL